LLRERSDLAGKLQAEHDEGLEPIGFDDQKIMVAEPVIQAAESVPSNFDFHTTIDAEQRHRDVATEAAARSAGQRNALGSKAGILERTHNRALTTIAFVT
jgi:hypothetical protein